MIGSIGFGEWMIIVSIALLLFGAKRIPEMAQSLGKSIVEFKKGLRSTVSEIAEEQEKAKPEIMRPSLTATKLGHPETEKVKSV